MQHPLLIKFLSSAWDGQPLILKKLGFRIAPGAIVRHGTFLAPQVVVMPSFINTVVFIDEGIMIDSHVRVGSCAQIGKNCHLSDAVGIRGVLEPPQAAPVIIEDNCFFRARCQLVEGVIVEEGAVLGMGVMIGASTKIIHRDTGQITYGRVPANSVVVPGSLASHENPLLSLNCAIIIKEVDPQTRKKTSLNDLLCLLWGIKSYAYAFPYSSFAALSECHSS